MQMPRLLPQRRPLLHRLLDAAEACLPIAHPPLLHRRLLSITALYWNWLNKTIGQARRNYFKICYLC